MGRYNCDDCVNSIHKDEPYGTITINLLSGCKHEKDMGDQLFEDVFIGKVECPHFEKDTPKEWEAIYDGTDVVFLCPDCRYIFRSKTLYCPHCNSKMKID